MFFRAAVLLAGIGIGMNAHDGNAVLRTSNGTGAWNAGGTWLGGAVPGCGDSIVIRAGDLVSVTNQQNYTGCGTRMAVVISGTLYFSGGSKLRMPCSSNFYALTIGAVDSNA